MQIEINHESPYSTPNSFKGFEFTDQDFDWLFEPMMVNSPWNSFQEKTVSLPIDCLAGNSLEWAVAKAVGPEGNENKWLFARKAGTISRTNFLRGYGGWLLQQCEEHSMLDVLLDKGMLVERVAPQTPDSLPKYKVTTNQWKTAYQGDALLIAICKGFVALKLGSIVHVPEEVLELY